jgi:hypothetical protein
MGFLQHRFYARRRGDYLPGPCPLLDLEYDPAAIMCLRTLLLAT